MKRQVITIILALVTATTSAQETVTLTGQNPM